MDKLVAKAQQSPEANEPTNEQKSQVKVNTEILEKLMKAAGELVLTRNQLLHLLKADKASVFAESLQKLDSITKDLQEAAIKANMQPLSSVFVKLQRLIRDISEKSGREIEFEVSGSEVLLDIKLLEIISTSLAQIVKNRTEKAGVGKINMEASSANGFILLEIYDDGNGSFAGVDGLRDAIGQVGGIVQFKEVESKIIIRVPACASIMPVLKLEVQGNKFAIPQINIREVVKLGGASLAHIESSQGQLALRLRGHLLPLLDLAELLGFGDAAAEPAVIICETGNHRFGVIVDKVLDAEEVVAKPVSPGEGAMFSGSTILGDGSTIFILDLTNLAKASGELPDSAQKHLNDNQEDGQEKSSFVIFQAGDETPKAAPLELLYRLEEIDAENIEHSRVEYHGETMRLVGIDPAYKFPSNGTQELLVVSDGANYMGIAVEKIIDIVKVTKTNISGGRKGFLGQLVIDGKTCDVIDVEYYFNKAFKSGKKEGKNPSSRKILLVDDSPFFRKFIPPELEAAGFVVTTAANGKDALAELASKSYMALVTDMDMPGMDGAELAHSCRQISYLKDLPIIALLSDKDDVEITGEFSATAPKTNQAELVKILLDIAGKVQNAA